MVDLRRLGVLHVDRDVALAAASDESGLPGSADWPSGSVSFEPVYIGGYEVQFFPVRDLHFNNIPALSRSRFIPDAHRFRTAQTDDPDEQLVIYLRSTSSKRTGTSSRP